MKKIIATLILSTTLISGGTAMAEENTTTQQQHPQQLQSIDRSSYIDWRSRTELKDIKITNEKGHTINPKESFVINVVHAITPKEAKTIAKQVKNNEVEKSTIMIIKTVVVVTQQNEVIATPVASIFYIPDDKNKKMVPINEVFKVENPIANQDLGNKIQEIYKNQNIKK